MIGLNTAKVYTITLDKDHLSNGETFSDIFPYKVKKGTKSNSLKLGRAAFNTLREAKYQTLSVKQNIVTF